MILVVVHYYILRIKFHFLCYHNARLFSMFSLQNIFSFLLKTKKKPRKTPLFIHPISSRRAFPYSSILTLSSHSQPFPPFSHLPKPITSSFSQSPLSIARTARKIPLSPGAQSQVQLFHCKNVLHYSVPATLLITFLHP